ncbi:MAG TPA: hypothetical protein PLO50_15400, partial [Nitrospira sp.]|nr:hypothetical protein [Nitrospira sp.]
KRILPTSLAPICFFPREESEWLLDAMQDDQGHIKSEPPVGLTSVAQDLCHAFAERGACFFADLVRTTGHLPTEVENGLWELVAAGLVTADGFDNLRALLDPHRRRAEGRERLRRPRHAAGRWSLLRSLPSQSSALSSGNLVSNTQHSALSEKVARQLLRRYGVVFRDLLVRESLVQSWRDLLVIHRKLALKGEVRGGRFVSGFVGEQFAFPEAVEALRALRKSGVSSGAVEITLSACDPLNLAGIILPGPRVPAVPTNVLVFRDRTFVRTGIGHPRDQESSVAKAIDLTTVRQPL